ncbi:FkbM family methyltransferase [Sediminibacterium sp.]|uniref:FkbM family methyltransferase n=1 Tax=Sediminibacterium sp. TaxID=1917865 RepID=UPI0025D50C92|nr:FkbM family methyltransferase [Sediminibacterium sp.]MDO9157727.1 FkbM family methyltransferase [Sediminibacterium sp.]MDP1973887.1 FkbM family methyltransferase [Sediminibacterium sp.]MDP2421083.1 FkbM family methyltransferase [Sediminibacterium sp.]
MVQQLKSFIQLVIQKILGYRTYLYVFSIYRALKFRLFRDDADFNIFIDLVKSSKPSTIIDAGANVGYTAVIFAKEFPHYSIIAYEPVSLLSTIITKVVQFFKLHNVTVKQLALGNSNGLVTIKTPIISGVKKQGLSFIDVAVEREDADLLNNFLEEQVQMVSLDADLMGKLSYPVSGIKVDVENFEYFVLQGTIELIKQYKPIVMAELWDNARKNACIDLMKNEGYNVKVISNKTLVDYTNQQSLNYFFIPK